jgi:uncharacterized protein YggU (UPF0235/DUF167 family)
VKSATLELQVHPRSAARGVGPWVGGVLHLRVTGPAADDEANAAAIALLAESLGVAPSRITLVRGRHHRRKAVTVAGLDGAEVARRLEAHAD